MDMTNTVSSCNYCSSACSNASYEPSVRQPLLLFPPGLQVPSQLH